MEERKAVLILPTIVIASIEVARRASVYSGLAVIPDNPANRSAVIYTPVDVAPMPPVIDWGTIPLY